MIPNSVLSRLSTFVVLVGPLVTLTITPWFNYDPINLGKNLALSVFAFAGFGLIIPYINKLLQILGRFLVAVSLLFSLTLFLPLLLTSAPASHQIWGQFGRGTGIITYLGLLIIFVLSSIPQEKSHFDNILKALIFTQSIMTLYCLLQLSGNDPVQWSAHWTFGTLGNVNFLSGYMGISIVASIILAANPRARFSVRIFLLIISLLDVYIVATTDSIQGLVALAVGVALFMGFLAIKKGTLYVIPYLVLASAGFVSLVLALLDKGPLRSVIYQVTVLFRADYMHAGLRMLLDNPLTGIGIDSFDDWYRSERGVISAFRTSLNRTANSAHNVMLDLGSGGGFPLMTAYVLLILLVVRSIYRGLKKGMASNYNFLAFVCSWVSYQVQASVSINQIGVGIWGWLLGGSIISFENSFSAEVFENQKADRQKKKYKKHSKMSITTPNTPPALAVISSSVSLIIGSYAAFIPFKVDMDFYSASRKGSLDLMIESTKGFASNAFLLSQANESALRNNFPDQARVLNDRLVNKFPRNIYAWQTRLNLPGLTETDREMAVRKIKELDPYLGLCLEENPVAKIERVIFSLPSAQQFELAKNWGFVNEGQVERMNFQLGSFKHEEIIVKLRSFCGV